MHTYAWLCTQCFIKRLLGKLVNTSFFLQSFLAHANFFANISRFTFLKMVAKRSIKGRYLYKRITGLKIPSCIKLKPVIRTYAIISYLLCPKDHCSNRIPDRLKKHTDNECRKKQLSESDRPKNTIL